MIEFSDLVVERDKGDIFMKTIPYAHQLEAFNRSKDAFEYGLFLEMGTGKTKVAIDTICHLWLTKKIDCALVLAPKGVVPVWVTELDKHQWYDVRSRIVVWNTARSDGGLSALYTPLDGPLLRIVVMNIEAISTRRGVLGAAEFLQRGPGLMVVDESTTIKNGSANRAKGAIWLGKIAVYRRILTGMPVEQSPLDLYSQCEFLKPGLLGHRSYYSFRGAYADLVSMTVLGKTFKKVVGYRNLELLSKTLQSFSYRVTKDECLDLPPKVYQVIEVELTAEQKRAYKDMRRKAVVSIQESDQKSTAVIALTQIMRLHQVVCGFLPMDNGTTLELPGNRLNVLLGLLEETQGKVVIWASYRKNVLEIWRALFDKYGTDSAVTYYGDSDDRPGALEKFQNDPECRFFVGTPKTGGMGLTLAAASTMVFYSNSYSVRDRVQAEDRAHRIGQTKTLIIIDLIARGTVDETILNALSSKKELADLVVDGKWAELL